MPDRPRPVVLAILDGWGHSDSTQDNAIAAAATPNWDALLSACPHTLIDTSGRRVGLPEGQMGNSEVGHLNLGAGRVIYQEYTRISLAIEDGSFYANPVLCQAVDAAVEGGRAVHILGLLSPGGVHSHEAHIHAAIRLAAQRGAERIFVHAILDGRDTPPKSALASLEAVDALCAELGRGRIGSIIGRYYAMDRDQRWERVEQAYALYTEGRAAHVAADAGAGLAAAYARGETDEFITATRIGEADMAVADGDAVLFMNFRADRAREITRCFVEDEFAGFARERRPAVAAFVCLTQYQAGLPVAVAYPPERPRNTLGEYVSGLGMRQLRIAETEKYAHVTFFFNGGEEQPYPGEDRILVPSPKVATYDLQPQMSAPEVTDRLVEAVGSGVYDLIVCNYANADMVGHTGIFDAAVAAIEALDSCIGRLVKAVRAAGGEMLITADHGNAELMRDRKTGQPHTAHTTNLVPLVYVGRPADLLDDGVLSDIAPSLLTLMDLPIPPEMTGHPLVRLRGT